MESSVFNYCAFFLKGDLDSDRRHGYMDWRMSRGPLSSCTWKVGDIRRSWRGGA
jgi:hypothetical protein